MSQAQFTIPLITVIPGQLITAALWNNEFVNLQTNLNPSGIGGYSDTDTQMQIQTAPYPGSVTSHASSLAGELERVRYQISQILGPTTPAFWYAAPPTNLTALAGIALPLGAVIDYHSATPPNSNFLLANGQAIGRSAFAGLNALYSAASYPFGNGDGSTTFNLPNYTDRMSITAGNLYALAATGGAVNATLAANQIPTSSLGVSVTDPGHNHIQNAHSHGVTDPGHTHLEKGDTTGGGSGAAVSGNFGFSGTDTTTGNTTASATTGVTTNNATATNNANTTGITASVTGGGSTPVPTLPPYIGMYKMIRVL
jgi:hypothetical protein